MVLRVSDIERAIAFYRDQVGFALDHHRANEHMDVAQLTPRGSGCSIVVGNLPSQNEMAPGRCGRCSSGPRRVRGLTTTDGQAVGTSGAASDVSPNRRRNRSRSMTARCTSA